MARFPLLVSLTLAGCSVPTPVGELQQAGASAGATSSTSTVGPGDSSSSSTASAPTGSSTDPASSSSSGEAVVAEMTSFAIRRGDVPDEEPTDTQDTASEVGVGTGAFGDPDDLLVTIGFTAADCQDPFASDACGTWSALLTFAPEQQVTGTYTDEELNAFLSEQGAPDDSASCPGSGGTLDGFTITLEAIDETGLELVFDGNGFGPSALDLNGMSFSVPRCT